MQLPLQFDQNEWVILIGLLISFALVIRLPRRGISKSVLILMMLFSSAIARLFDVVLAGTQLDLYDIMDRNTLELFDILTYFYYAPFAYFFIYGYEKLQVRGLWIWLYILGCSILGTLFEGINVYFNIFTYKEWTLFYSFPVYLFVQTCTLLLYTYLKKKA